MGEVVFLLLEKLGLDLVKLGEFVQIFVVGDGSDLLSDPIRFSDSGAL